MTGWVFIAAFLASWRPVGGWLQLVKAASDLFSKYSLDYGALGALVVAILGSPIVGYVISTFVIVYMYARFGDPYNFHSRTMVRLLVEKSYRRLCEPNGKPSGGGRDFFAYFLYTRGPQELVEWGRRRHTTRFIGYNWTFATVLGLTFGWTEKLRLASVACR